MAVRPAAARRDICACFVGRVVMNAGSATIGGGRPRVRVVWRRKGQAAVSGRYSTPGGGTMVTGGRACPPPPKRRDEALTSSRTCCTLSSGMTTSLSAPVCGPDLLNSSAKQRQRALTGAH